MTSDAHRYLWTGPEDDPDRYRLELPDGDLVEVGGGGEGLIYDATRAGDPPLRVALKLFTSVSIDAYPQIADAARLLAGVEHPNLMRQVETFRGRAFGPASPLDGDDFSIIYSANEWIDGEPFDTAVERQGAVAGLRWVGDVARALAALHASRSSDAPQGVVHGDVKPSNVRINRTGDAMLIDFGFTRAHDVDGVASGTGTFRWRAPELVSGDAGSSPAADAWGIGALAYWVVVGEPPRIDAPDAVLEQFTSVALDKGFLNAGALASHIAPLLAADPASRPFDLERWADELDRLIERRRHVSWFRRPALVALCAALIGVVGGICLTMVVQAIDHDADDASRTPRRPGSAMLLARRFAVPESRPGEVVLRQDHIVNYRDGRVLLSGGRDGDGELLVNDELELQVTHPDGAIATYAHNYGTSSNCAHDEGTPPQDVTGLFEPGRNIVRVIVRGGCNGGDVGLGGFAGAGSSVWMVFGA